MTGQRELRAAGSWPPEVAEYPDRRGAPPEPLIRSLKGVIAALHVLVAYLENKEQEPKS